MKITVILLLNSLLMSLLSPVRAEVTLTLDGVMAQGGHVIGQTKPGASVSLDGELLPVTPSGRFFIGFDRDAASTQLLVVRSGSGETLERELSLQKRRYQIERIDGLPPATVNPPASVTERIQKEAAAVATARLHRDMRSDWEETFAMPATGRLSGFFGSQRVLNGEPKRPHYGLDVAAPTGTPVLAPAAGIITLAEPDLYYSGGTIILDHGHGLSSTFLHLSSVDIVVGQRVNTGDAIGKIGATGRASGPHLDWRMNWRDQRIDPHLFIDENAWEPVQ